MIEVLGLAARIVFEVLLELLGWWDFSFRPGYRRYLRTVPAGEKPLTKREWKAAGKPERVEGSTRTA